MMGAHNTPKLQIRVKKCELLYEKVTDIQYVNDTSVEAHAEAIQAHDVESENFEKLYIAR